MLIEIVREFIFLILKLGQQEIVGEFPGMTFAPRFSPRW